MKYFAVFLQLIDKEKSDLYRNDHLDFLSTLRSQGTVIMNGKFTDGTGGLVIYRGKSFNEVEEIVKKDPYIIQGARDFEIHEWEMVSSDNF